MSLIEKVNSTKGRILIVDDEKDVRDVLKMQLLSEKYDIIEAENGEEAINLMKEGSNLLRVGLIICDIRMPKVNGVEAIEYLKQNAPSIPILVVTGYPDTEMALSLIKRGVKDYLVKPVNKEELLKKVKNILSDHDFEYA